MIIFIIILRILLGGSRKMISSLVMA